MTLRPMTLRCYTSSALSIQFFISNFISIFLKKLSSFPTAEPHYTLSSPLVFCKHIHFPRWYQVHKFFIQSWILNSLFLPGLVVQNFHQLFYSRFTFTVEGKVSSITVGRRSSNLHQRYRVNKLWKEMVPSFWGNIIQDEFDVLLQTIDSICSFLLPPGCLRLS